MGDPHVTYTGPTAIWWIPKPRGPRVSLALAFVVWLAGAAVTGATLLWAQAQLRPLWPFGHPISSLPEILLRYEIILLVCLVYVTLRSLPMWVRHSRLARQDAKAIASAVEAEQWEQAGLLIHRYCLLVSAIRHRLPARVAAWDAVIRPKLPRHRRLYVYHRDQPPPLPPDTSACFAPAVIPPRQPPLWSAAGLIPIALLLYLLILDILRNRYWQRLILFNAALLFVILVIYGTYFLLALLGRSYYFRFAPGVVQVVKFRLWRRRPAIEAFDLRQAHAVLDLSCRWPALTLLQTPARRRETFRLPRRDDVVEAVLRACLSTTPSPPLPEEGLIE